MGHINIYLQVQCILSQLLRLIGLYVRHTLKIINNMRYKGKQDKNKKIRNEKPMVFLLCFVANILFSSSLVLI